MENASKNDWIFEDRITACRDTSAMWLMLLDGSIMTEQILEESSVSAKDTFTGDTVTVGLKRVTFQLLGCLTQSCRCANSDLTSTSLLGHMA